MQTYKQFIDEAVRYGEKRCTAVTCNAIASYHGVDSAKLGPDHIVGTGAGVVQHLRAHGMKIKGQGWEHEGKSVKKFVSEHPTGAHYIAIRGHAMAVINGKLHDSSGRGADGRKLQLSFEVTKA
jgi:hypothetical protein